jgi:hypothetical protein
MPQKRGMNVLHEREIGTNKREVRIVETETEMFQDLHGLGNYDRTDMLAAGVAVSRSSLGDSCRYSVVELEVYLHASDFQRRHTIRRP